jgi:hypothetical protein
MHLLLIHCYEKETGKKTHIGINNLVRTPDIHSVLLLLISEHQQLINLSFCFKCKTKIRKLFSM